MLFDDSMYVDDDWSAEIRADYAAHPEMFVDPADLVWDDDEYTESE